MNKRLTAVLCALVLTGCGPAAPDMDDLAREYLYLELSMGLHDSGHVDAYFGPQELQAAAIEAALSLDQILSGSADLAERLSAIDTGDDEMFGMRISGLIASLQALDTRIAINKGEFLSFDDESMALFGSAAPDNDAAHFETILQELDALLPGDEPLSKRVKYPANPGVNDTYHE